MNISESYWEGRAVVGMERNKEETLSVIKDVNKEYKKKLKEIRYEIADFYAKHGKNNVLEYSKITSKLDDDDFNTMIRDWDKFVVKYPDMKKYRDIRMAYYKFDRLQGLSNRIALHVAELGKTEEEMLQGTLRGTFKKAFKNIVGLFRKQKVISRDVELMKDKRIDKMIRQKWFDNNNFSDRIWKDKAKLQHYLDTKLISDMAVGKSYDEVTKELAKAMNTHVSNAGRLIHTEMSNIQNRANFEGIKKAGFEGYKIVATLDGRTSEICRGKNGKSYYIDDYQTGVTAPPFHPYCRSTIFGVDKVESDNPFDNTNALDVFGEENYNIFKEKLSEVEDERALKLFDALGGKITYNPLNNKVTPYAFNNTVQIGARDFGDYYNGVPTLALFHENGHALDHLGLVALTGKRGIKSGVTIKKKIAGQMEEIEMLIHHASGLPKYKLKETINDDIWRYFNGDLPTFESLGKKPRSKVAKEEWELEYTRIYREFKANTKRIFDRIISEQNSSRNYAGLSDILESTGWFGEFPLGAGHGKNYWKHVGMAETEFFAHAQEMLVDKGHAEVMREVFPNALKVYENIVDDIIEGVKNNDNN